MKTKGKLFFSLIAFFSALVLFLALFVFRRGEPAEKPEPKDPRKEEIISARKEALSRIETSVSFNGFDLFYDQESDTYYYSLLEGMESSYYPEIRVEGVHGKVDVAPADHITDEMIEENEPFEFIAYDNKEYRRIKVVCTTLPIISITCDGEIEDGYTGMTMRLFDNRKGAVSRLTICDGKIRTRGNTSALFDKKGYRLTLLDLSPGNNRRELEAGLLGMRQDGDWILYAAYNDQERIRNVFSTNLWYNTCSADNSFGINNGSEYRFAELMINGEYRGLYAFGYPVDEKQLAIQPGEYMYQKYTWTKDLTLNYLDFDELKANFEVREGNNDVDEAAMWAPLARYYRILQGVDGKKGDLAEISDMNNSIDVFLFFNLIQGVDNVNGWATLNLDQTVKKKDGRLLMVYTPWDMDQSWGNAWATNRDNWINPYGVKPDFNRVMKASPVYLLIMNGDLETLDLVKSRYEELRNGDWSEDALMSQLGEYEKQIFGSGAYARDLSRWPDSTHMEDPSDGLSVFMDHVKDRLEYMDDYIEDLSPEGIAEEYEVFDYDSVMDDNR